MRLTASIIFINQGTLFLQLSFWALKAVNERHNSEVVWLHFCKEKILSDYVWQLLELIDLWDFCFVKNAAVPVSFCPSN